MKKHFLNNWGWYGITLFQALLIVLKLEGFFPYVDWVGILVPVIIIGVVFVGFYIWFICCTTRKSPKE
jgi:hypothetical protein